MAKKVGQLHTEVFKAYQELLQGGEAQLLMKMKSFWAVSYTHLDVYKRQASMYAQMTLHIVQQKPTMNWLITTD